MGSTRPPPPSLPPPPRARAGRWGPAGAAPRLKEGERRALCGRPGCPPRGQTEGPCLRAAPPGALNPPPRFAGVGRSGEGSLALPRGSGNVPAAAHAAGSRGCLPSRLLPPHKQRRRRQQQHPRCRRPVTSAPSPAPPLPPPPAAAGPRPAETRLLRRLERARAPARQQRTAELRRARARPALRRRGPGDGGGERGTSEVPPLYCGARAPPCAAEPMKGQGEGNALSPLAGAGTGVCISGAGGGVRGGLAGAAGVRRGPRGRHVRAGREEPLGSSDGEGGLSLSAFGLCPAVRQGTPFSCHATSAFSRDTAG